MADGADEQVGVQAAEHPLDVLQVLAGLHRAVGAEHPGGEAGADHVHPVQGGLAGDLLLVAAPGEGVVGDLHDEVLGHLLLVDDLPGGQGDGVLAAQRPAGPPGRRGDLFQLGFGGIEQLAALAGPLGGQERVVAGDQPLAGVAGVGDLGHAGVVEQGGLDGAAGHEGPDRRAAQRGDPVQAGGPHVVVDPGLGEHAAVPDQGHVGQAEPRFQLLDLVACPRRTSPSPAGPLADGLEITAVRHGHWPDADQDQDSTDLGILRVAACH